jgi:hypothetical protein
MSLGTILVIILIIVLLGGIGPHFYSGAPWQPGYGFGNGGISVVGITLVILVVLLLTGRL